MKRALLVLAGLLAISAPAGADRGTEPEEAKLRAKIAKDWTDVATWLAGLSMKGEALKALEEARASKVDAPDLPAVVQQIDAITIDAAPTATSNMRVKKTREDTAKHWDKIADLLGGARDEIGPAEAFARAFDFDPSKPRFAKLTEAAKKHITLVKAPGHPLVAWIALPDGWKPGKEYPVLVTVEGAGANFVGNAVGYLGSRGARDVILVTPYALSCTNAIESGKFPPYEKTILDAHAKDQMKRLEFDVAGLEAVLGLVTGRFGGAPKAMITGFSGGGMLAYGFTIGRPAKVSLCAPACPNFHAGLRTFGQPVTDGGPPVRIFTGGADQYKDAVGNEMGIEAQTDAAVAALTGLGFKDVKRTMLPGVAHSTCMPQVWSAVDELVGGKKK